MSGREDSRDAGAIPFELVSPANDDVWRPRKPTATEVRAAAGRRAQRSGDELEKLLASHGSLAIATGRLAWLRKIPAGVAYGALVCACGKAHRVLKWAEQACADFLGADRRARSLVIEAKSVEGDDGGRLYRAEVMPQQSEQLDAAAASGGVALLVVEFRETGKVLVRSTVCVIPWREVPWQTLRKSQSLSLDGARPWALRQGLFLERFLPR